MSSRFTKLSYMPIAHTCRTNVVLHTAQLSAQTSEQCSTVTGGPPGLPALSPAGPSALRPIMGTNTCGCPIKPTNLRWRIDTSTFTPKCLCLHISAPGLAWQKYLSTPCWPSLVLDRQKFPLSPDPLDLLDNGSFHRLLDVVRSKDAAHDDVEQLLIHLNLKMGKTYFFQKRFLPTLMPRSLNLLYEALTKAPLSVCLKCERFSQEKLSGF